MERYIGPLILLSTAAGLLCVVLAAWWILGRHPLTGFRKVAATFICAGAVIPVAILPVWFWLDRHRPWGSSGTFESFAVTLWPTSIVLMGLEGPDPQPWSTIAFVYAFSILGIVGVYGTAGLLVGCVYDHFKPRLASKGD
jgi:hypothetical protein